MHGKFGLEVLSTLKMGIGRLASEKGSIPPNPLPAALLARLRICWFFVYDLVGMPTAHANRAQDRPLINTAVMLPQCSACMAARVMRNKMLGVGPWGTGHMFTPFEKTSWCVFRGISHFGERTALLGLRSPILSKPRLYLILRVKQVKL